MLTLFDFYNAQDLYEDGKQLLEGCVDEKRRYDAFLQVLCCQKDWYIDYEFLCKHLTILLWYRCVDMMMLISSFNSLWWNVRICGYGYGWQMRIWSVPLCQSIVDSECMDEDVYWQMRVWECSQILIASLWWIVTAANMGRRGNWWRGQSLWFQQGIFWFDHKQMIIGNENNQRYTSSNDLIRNHPERCYETVCASWWRMSRRRSSCWPNSGLAPHHPYLNWFVFCICIFSICQHTNTKDTAVGPV